MEKETIIELKNIRKEFPGVVALDNVNMKIRASEVHALVGENGAGKSTLMNLITQNLEPDEGEILINGISTAKWALLTVMCLVTCHNSKDCMIVFLHLSFCAILQH